MKVVEEVFNFCKDISFSNHHSIDRVIELNQMGDFITNNLSGYEYKDEKLYSRVLGIIDDISLRFIDEHLKKIGDKINILRVGLLQLICLEELHKDNFNGEVGFDEINSFRIEKWTEQKFGCDINNICSLHHEVYLQQVKKPTLSQFDDKRCYEKNIVSIFWNYNY